MATCRERSPRRTTPACMKAFRVEDGCGKLLLDYPVPKPKPGEALVKVLRAAICATDFELLSGYKGGYTGVLGHEFVGMVVEINPSGAGDNKELIGKRVCGELNVSCFSCGVCGQGGSKARNHCSSRTVLGIIGHDGTYAEYLVLPVINLHVVPDKVSTEAAAFVEPLAAAYRIIEQDLIKTEDRVCVIGDGKLGLLIAEVIASQNLTNKLVLVGRHPERAALLGDRVQARQVSRDQADLPSDLDESFDVVVDVTGTPQGLQMATNLVVPMGTVVLKTTCAKPVTANTSMYVVKEIKLIGSRCGPFDKALEILENGEFDVSKYITAVYPLDDVEEALAMAKSRGCLKVQLAVASSEMDSVRVNDKVSS